MSQFDPNWMSAISSIESGGRYGITGPQTRSGDRAYGKYQVMGANIGPWTQAALGRELSPQEFLADPEAQDAVFKNRFGGYVEKYGTPQDAASAWFTGRPINAASARSADVLGTTGAGYVEKFNNALGNNAGVSAIQSAMKPQEGAPSMMGYADDGTGALSTNSTMGPGVLLTGARAAQQDQGPNWDKALMGVASSLAGIYSPQQAQALNQQQELASEKQTNAGYTLHVDPKTGKGLRMSKDGQIVQFQAFTPKEEPDESSKAYTNARGKANSDLYDKIDADAASSQTNLGNIAKLRSMLANPNVYQGAGGETIASLKKLGASIGFNVEGVADTDVARSLMNQMTLGMRNFAGGMPGALSDNDLKFLNNMGSSLNNTPEGNAAILDNIGRVHQRNIDVQKMRDKYAAEQGKVDDGFRSLVSQFARDNPLFPEQAATPKTAAPRKDRPPLSSIFK